MPDSECQLTLFIQANNKIRETHRPKSRVSSACMGKPTSGIPVRSMTELCHNRTNFIRSFPIYLVLKSLRVPIDTRRRQSLGLQSLDVKLCKTVYSPVMPMCILLNASVSPSCTVVSTISVLPIFRPFLICTACGA